MIVFSLLIGQATYIYHIMDEILHWAEIGYMFSRKAAAGVIKPETLPPTGGAVAVACSMCMMWYVYDVVCVCCSMCMMWYMYVYDVVYVCV